MTILVGRRVGETETEDGAGEAGEVRVGVHGSVVGGEDGRVRAAGGGQVERVVAGVEE